MRIQVFQKDWKSEELPSSISFSDLTSLVRSRNQGRVCLVYLTNSGDLCSIASSEDLKQAISLMNSSFQSVLILMVEDLQKFSEYNRPLSSSPLFTSSPAKLKVIEDPELIIVNTKDYDFEVIDQSMDESAEIQQYRVYKQEWTVKNTGKARWREVTICSTTKGMIISEQNVQQLMCNDKGKICVMFQIIDCVTSKVRRKIDWVLKDKNGIRFGRNIEHNVIVNKFPQVDELVSLQFEINQAVEALDANENDVNAAADYLFNKY